jgi:hypothetical protein
VVVACGGGGGDSGGGGVRKKPRPSAGPSKPKTPSVTGTLFKTPMNAGRYDCLKLYYIFIGQKVSGLYIETLKFRGEDEAIGVLMLNGDDTWPREIYPGDKRAKRETNALCESVHFLPRQYDKHTVSTA